MPRRQRPSDRRRQRLTDPPRRSLRGAAGTRLGFESLEGRLLLAADFGDAPDTYGTTTAGGGAYHAVAGWFLGASRDVENDGAPGILADGDGDDDDGVTFSPLRAGSEASIRILVTQLPAANNPNLKLDAWIDFDGDGTFSGALERIAAAMPVRHGEHWLTINVPTWAAQGTTYARFRLSSTGPLAPGGDGGFGEVEDYAVEILAPNAAGGDYVEQLVVNGSTGASTLYPVDIDGDGDLDLIANDQRAGRIAVHRNDGQGNFTQQLISSFSVAKEIAAGDFDRDGLTDLLITLADTVRWLRQSSDGTFGTGTSSSANAAVAADMLKDGRLDVLTASPNPNIFRILRDASSSNIQNVAAGTTAGTAVDAADIDGDGDVDFLGATSGDNSIAWYEYLGVTAGYARRVITTDATSVASASLVDLDSDGDLDVLSYAAGDGEIEWFENDGAQIFTRHLIATIVGVFEISRADVDGDGDLDLLVAAGAAGARLLTNDGSQTFAASTLPTSSTVGIQAIAAGDFDGDGVLEIAVGGAYPAIGQPPGYLALLRKQPALDFGDAPESYGATFGDGGPHHYPSGPTLGATRDSELDGGSPAVPDGADEDGVMFGALNVGATSATAVVNVQNAPAGARLDAWIDFDGDGTFNGANERIAANRLVVEGENVVMFAIPVGAASGATYARFRLSSVGGLGPLGGAADGEVEDYAVTIASPAGSGLFDANYYSSNTLGTFAIAVDFDGDRDVDVVTVDSSARWFKNDGAGNFTQLNLNLVSQGSLESLQFADFDGDGDLDVLTKFPTSLYWNENLGNLTFRSERIQINELGARPPVIVDYDRDGDLDFVVAVGSEIRLIENLGAANFAPRTLVANAPGRYYSAATALAVADADGDGDLDVYVAPNDSYLQLVLYRNEGSGNFTRADVVALGSSLFFFSRTQTLSPVDFDGDGDIDLAVALRNSSLSSNYPATAHTLGWYENRGNGDVDFHLVSSGLGDFRQMTVGDADGDGDFDFMTSYVNFGRIVWHENLSGGAFAVRQLSLQGVSFSSNYSIFPGVALGDLDGDGDLDVATTIQSGSGLHWMEQLAAPVGDYGDAPYPYPVELSANGPTHVATGPRLGARRDAEVGPGNSADGDGDGIDDDGVTFAPFRVGQLGATVSVNVQNAPTGARLDAWIDFDGDGNWSRAEERIAANVVVVEGENVVRFDVPSWAVAGNSYARFRISTSGGLGYTGGAADGEVEDHAVLISPPATATGPYLERHAIDNSYRGWIISILTVDLDGDGDNDVLAPSFSSQDLLWYDNNGAGSFTVRILTGVRVSSLDILAAADVDLDGDMDLVSHGIGSNYQYVNDGAQNFTTRGFQSFSSGGSNDRKFVLLDIEGDGDVDYLDAAQWIQNLATTSSYLPTSWNSGSNYPSNFADVDRNGSIDVLFRSNSSSTSLGYWTREFESFQFKAALGNLTETPQRLSTADLDRDGDLDLLVAASNAADGIIWLENDGAMNYTRRVIGGVPVGSIGALGAAPVGSTGALAAADVDGDGDLDVLASSLNETAWFENNGEQSFAKHSVLPAGGLLSLADMNGDGTLDVVIYDRSINGPVSGLAWYSLTDRQLSIAVAPSTIDEEGSASVVFTFTRAGATDAELTVPFTVGGNALYGVDYTVSGAASFDATAGTITFAAGATSVEMALTPIDDAVKELHEKATLTIPPLAGYSIANAIATATIRTAELAGDYDSDGTVDGADFLAWQRSFGVAADPIGSGADGNLDGETDGDDLAVWTANFGQTTATPTPPAPSVAALVAADEASTATTSTAETDAGSWYGRLTIGEASIIHTVAAPLTTKRVERLRDLRDEVFARADRWSHGQVGARRLQSGTRASSQTTEDAEKSDAETFDDLAFELVRAWREF